jgi:hypothetical protein
VADPREPSRKIEITPEMVEAGAAVLEDFTAVAGGLTNSAGHVAERVYQAMERQRRETLAGRTSDC